MRRCHATTPPAAAALAGAPARGRPAADPANTTGVPMPAKGGNPALTRDDLADIVGRLGLDRFEVADPYVERLMEGFAFLAARIQRKLDDEFPSFTSHLLEMVYPDYLAPTPSMVVVTLEPDRRAVRGHHHDLARLLALGLEDRHQRHGQMRRMGEDQVDVRVDQQLVLEDRAGVLGLPLHRRVGDDLDLGRLGRHHRLEALLDVERVVVAGIAEDLQKGEMIRRISELSRH